MRAKTLAVLAVCTAAGLSLMFVLGSNSDPGPTTAGQAVERTTPAAGTAEPGSCDRRDCVLDDLLALTTSQGPAAAISRYHEFSEIYPELKSSCHGIYEKIGREVAMTSGLGEYQNHGCQFGYLHGLLYGIGEFYDDPVELVEDLRAYCALYPKDDTAFSMPRGSCYHGVGHALAEATHDDPKRAVELCDDLGENAASGCSDGVLMEYGDDYLYAIGFMSASGSDSTDDHGTVFDASTVRALCRDLPSYATRLCFARIWKFVVADPTVVDITAANEVCNTGPSEDAINSCFEGFGELVSHMTVKSLDPEWPPASKETADIAAKRLIDGCLKLDRPGKCLFGAAASALSHLYAVDMDDTLVPDLCKFAPAEILSDCLAARSVAQNLNWDKVAATANEDPSVKSSS